MLVLLKYVSIFIVCNGFSTLCRCQEFRTKAVKYILIWDRTKDISNSLFRSGSTAFQDCPVSNCYVSKNKDFFHGSMNKFDAIIFNGYSLPDSYDCERYPHQKYVYANMEPSTQFPICEAMYDNFFNWTATYRLDSDFVFPYFMIKNASGSVVGPSKDIKWVENMQEVDENFAKALNSKTKAVAWFVSKCNNKDRNQFVDDLKKALKQYNLKVDVFGRCGTHKCPKSRVKECLTRLKKDYFFYLALETIHAEDYVTERVIPALQNYVVPIVSGGADYDRFLPPESYINGKTCTANELATKINNLIKTPEKYRQYFKWRRYYRYVSTTPNTFYKGDGVCKFCKALNDKDDEAKETTKRNIRSWWDPKYSEHCKKNCEIKETKEEATAPVANVTLAPRETNLRLYGDMVIF